MIAAMLKHFKPRMAPPKFCHPGRHVPPRVGQRHLRSMPGDDRKNRGSDAQFSPSLTRSPPRSRD